MSILSVIVYALVVPLAVVGAVSLALWANRAKEERRKRADRRFEDLRRGAKADAQTETFRILAHLGHLDLGDEADAERINSYLGANRRALRDVYNHWWR